MGSFAISLIRTYVPLAVGALVAWLATLGWHLDPATRDGLIVFLTAALAGAYYTVVRAAEQRFPWLGIFLGYTAKPHYVKPVK